MVWETEIKVIVSLERDSSALFYPLQKGVSMTFNDVSKSVSIFFSTGNIIVIINYNQSHNTCFQFQVIESKVERSSSASIAREFTLIYVPKKKQRKVWLLPYEDEWKDDVPVHTEHFLCML
jgi:hypothetical protein